MVKIKPLDCLVVLAMLVILDVTYGEFSETMKKQIRQGTKDLTEALVHGGTLLEKLKPLAGGLGIFGAFLTFAMVFVSAADSAEMKLMKKGFEKINLKLDSISSKIDDVKDLIKLETQRAQYITSESKILFGYKHLNKFQGELSNSTSCSTEQACKRERQSIAQRYVKSFDVKQNLFEIMKGTYSEDRVFAGPLLKLINNYHKCDIKKVYEFADGVIGLAYKGQQVVLAHEQLTGSNYSIISAMTDWIQMTYSIRKKANDIKSWCYKNIKSYVSGDVKDTKYQTSFNGNKEAAVALKKFLDGKYPWILWTVISYSVDDDEDHYGTEYVSNKGKQRTLRVTPSDNGTYTIQYTIADWIKRRSYLFGFQDIDYEDAHEIFDDLKSKIKLPAYQKLMSLAILQDETDLQIVSESELLIFNMMVTRKVVITKECRIMATFKSDEQIHGVRKPCKSCQFPSSCEKLPLTTGSYCKCSNFYYGESCEHYDSTKLASNIEKMLIVTSRLPNIVDVFHKLEDIQTYLAISIQNAITMLQETITTLQEETNFVIQYSESFRDLTYYLQRFATLNSTDPRYEAMKEELASIVVKPNGVQQWLFDLNLMIVGRQDILSTQPLIFRLIKENKNEACNTKYKKIIDSAWERLNILQTQAYIMWASSLAILKLSSDGITLMQEQRLRKQTNFMSNNTCEIAISNSNINCSGGYYVLPSMSFEIKCDEGYYLVGNSTVNCNDTLTSCRECGCNVKGSSSPQCDQRGNCNCTNNFYGNKCENRDCVWSDWSVWTGVPGKHRTGRRRYKIQTKQGNGKDCTGYSTDPCFGIFVCDIKPPCTGILCDIERPFRSTFIDR